MWQKSYSKTYFQVFALLKCNGFATKWIATKIAIFVWSS